jgi:hypothetical protein
MRVQKRYEIFADYHQFYLWDHGEKPDAPTDYDDADVARRIKAAPFVVVIQPARDMSVPVTVEIADAPPPDDPPGVWDHVAEASLDLPSGRLEIHECTGGPVDLLPVPAGMYRVRAQFGGLGTLSADGLDGADHYHVILWRAPFAPVRVLRQFEERG